MSQMIIMRDDQVLFFQMGGGGSFFFHGIESVVCINEYSVVFTCRCTIECVCRIYWVNRRMNTDVGQLNERVVCVWICVCTLYVVCVCVWVLGHIKWFSIPRYIYSIILFESLFSVSGKFVCMYDVRVCVFDKWQWLLELTERETIFMFDSNLFPIYVFDYIN